MGSQTLDRDYCLLCCQLVSVGIYACDARFLFALSGKNHQPISIHDALFFALVALGVISGVVLVLQAIFGPLMFTKNVICGRCQRQIKLERNPFWAGKRHTIPKCTCGGEYEPAFFWELKS